MTTYHDLPTPVTLSSRRLPAAVPSLRALIVDPQPAAGLRLALALSNEGIASHAVANGVEALSGLSRWEPNVVILDVTPPYFASVQLARFFRQSGLAVSRIIIAFTDLDISDLSVHLRGDEFDGYLQKRPSSGELAVYIRSFVML